MLDMPCSRRAVLVAILLAACSESAVALQSTDTGDLDTGECVEGAEAVGERCCTPGRVICGHPTDLLCGAGTWSIAADACGEMDAGHDAGPDANDACSDEASFVCIPGAGSGTVCCRGHRIRIEDGPCGLLVDAGTDAGICPHAVGCPCDADAGAAPCIDNTIGVCIGGTWQHSDHACGICN